MGGLESARILSNVGAGKALPGPEGWKACVCSRRNPEWAQKNHVKAWEKTANIFGLSLYNLTSHLQKQEWVL